jgi:predicted ATPase
MAKYAVSGTSFVKTQFIEAITSNSVLGEFRYEIDFRSTSHDSGRVVVIYAENGMGKTNFLKAVRHLLTPRLESLQVLAELFVDDLCVRLADGTRIELSPSDEPDALFECAIYFPESPDSRNAVGATIRPDDVDVRAFRRASPRNSVASYLQHLEAVVNPIIFVGDDRLVHSGEDIPLSQIRRTYEHDLETGRVRGRYQQSVRDALDKVERTLTRATIAGRAEDGAEAGEGVYVEITKRVLAGNNQELLAAAARTSLLNQARDVLDFAADFEKYGLMSFQQVRRIYSEIEGSRLNNSNFKALQGILEPYLSNVLAEVHGLRSAQQLIDTFVTSVNAFLERKHLSFSATQGITLVGRDKELLDPDNLSSGEKHLLLLLSNAVLARTTGALMIIDEPELSLGLKWQRKLLSELLKCTEGSNVQFLVASHSVQIMGEIDEVVSPTEAGGRAE